MEESPYAIIQSHLFNKGLIIDDICVFEKTYDDTPKKHTYIANKLYVIGRLINDHGSYTMADQYIIIPHTSKIPYVPFLIRGITYSTMEFIRKPSEFEIDLYYLARI